MTDRELLEAAARAAGIDRFSFDGHDDYIVDPSYIDADGFPVVWDPLTDDADAFRLAVKLRINVQFQGSSESTLRVIAGDTRAWAKFYDGDIASATRRAIVRAAAQIGGKQ